MARMKQRRKLQHGMTKTVKGRTYKLGKTSRWERAGVGRQLAGGITAGVGAIGAITGGAHLAVESGARIMHHVELKRAVRMSGEAKRMLKRGSLIKGASMYRKAQRSMRIAGRSAGLMTSGKGIAALATLTVGSIAINRLGHRIAVRKRKA